MKYPTGLAENQWQYKENDESEGQKKKISSSADWECLNVFLHVKW